jgi:hypothetical protein
MDKNKWLSDWRHWCRATMEATARRVAAEHELRAAKAAEEDAAYELEKFSVGIVELAAKGAGDALGERKTP